MRSVTDQTSAFDEAPLACSVRTCGLPLAFRGRVLVCAREHSYDIARSGYVNLLQPQDRRSRSAGDSKDAVAARARLMAAGVARGLVNGVIQRAAALESGARPVVLELGSGSGDMLAELSRHRSIVAVGIDLSRAAADHAARRFPALIWVVANADRRLPLLDRRVDLVLSVHARRNPVECARVLAAHGFLLVALPAPDDLIELRELVQGKAIDRMRADVMLAEHDPVFVLIERWSLRERQRLGREVLLDLLRGTYRGERLSAAERVAALDNLEVTLASEMFLFTPR